MSTDVSKARIGAFVCGAILFLVISMVLLGKNNLFEDDIEFILYFHSSVSGLSVGAPVVFRGVPLGRVASISLYSSAKSNNVYIPVIIKISKSNILQKGYGAPALHAGESSKDILKRMIKRGLRARIELGSLLTGQSRVELDFFPDTVAQYVDIKGKMPQIPTIDSAKDRFIRTVSELPLNKITKNLLSALEGISKIVNSAKLPETIDSFNETLLSSRKLFEKLDTTATNVNILIAKINNSAGAVDKEMPRMLKNFNNTMLNIANTFKQVEKTLAQAENVVSPNSTTIRNLNNAIKEFERASRSIRELANMLERNPESLLLGKGAK